MLKAFAKYTLMVLVLLLIPIAATSHDTGSKHKHEAAEKSPYKTIIIKGDMTIEGCGERDMEDYVFFIYSKYCPHCKKAMPIVEKIVMEQKIGSRYLPIDTSTKEGRGMLKAYGIQIQYVPTLIRNCKAYVGAKKPELYEKALRGEK